MKAGRRVKQGAAAAAKKDDPFLDEASDGDGSQSARAINNELREERKQPKYLTPTQRRSVKDQLQRTHFRWDQAARRSGKGEARPWMTDEQIRRVMSPKEYETLMKNLPVDIGKPVEGENKIPYYVVDELGQEHLVKGPMPPLQGWSKVGQLFRPPPEDVVANYSYTKLWHDVRAYQVRSVLYLRNQRDIIATYVDGTSVRVTLPYDPYLFPTLIRHGVDVDMEYPNFVEAFLTGICKFGTPLVTMYLIGRIIQAASSSASADDDIKSLSEGFSEGKEGMQKTSLDDVCGIENIRPDIEQLLELLRNEDHYKNLGCKPTRGVLLVGPPGTGKTMLARAIAQEAKTTFIATSGSEFQQSYVGVGSSKVRGLFDQARTLSPCIIFIDEFDAIGASRETRGDDGATRGMDELTATVNQMLTELDGFEENKGILVIAATNRPQVLDDALTRPGRFDRTIHMLLPDKASRMEIMSRNSEMFKFTMDKINWDRMGTATAGLSGADIVGMFNEVSRLLGREERTEAVEDDFIRAMEIVKRDLTFVNKNLTVGEAEENFEAIEPNLRTAVSAYVCAKALAAYALPSHEGVLKITAFPGGRPVGTVNFLQSEDMIELEGSEVEDKKMLTDKMTMLFVGREAERLLTNTHSPMGAKDIQEANFVARKMVLRYGMGRRLGPLTFVRWTGAGYLQSEQLAEEEQMMPMTREQQVVALREVTELVEIAQVRARDLVQKNEALLREVTSRVECDFEVTAVQLDEIIAKHGGTVQQPWDWPEEYSVVYDASSEDTPQSPTPVAA